MLMRAAALQKTSTESRLSFSSRLILLSFDILVQMTFYHILYIKSSGKLKKKRLARQALY
jgi:hypothetical protein